MAQKALPIQIVSLFVLLAALAAPAANCQDAPATPATPEINGKPAQPEASKESVERQDVRRNPKEKPLLQRGDLPNFHEVHPYLYRGGAPTEKGLLELKDKGVSTIIDLRSPGEMEIPEPTLAPQMGFKYIHMLMSSASPTPKQIETLLSTIDKAKEKTEAGDKNAAVFVHCAHGSDRTGCMIGIWRVTRENWDYPTAYAEMRKYYFTPKFTNLSGAVEKAAQKKEPH